MNSTLIGDIASIRMGVTLRGRDATRPDPKGSFRLIRISEIGDDGLLSTDDLMRFEPAESIRADHFLRPGDILFPNRGHRTTAGVFQLPERDVLVGSQIFVLRSNNSSVIPEYLAWYLRSEPAANHFAARRKGTLVQTLQRRDLEELPIPLPGLEKQSAIVALDALGRHERRLSSELQNLHTLLLQRSLLVAAANP